MTDDEAGRLIGGPLARIGSLAASAPVMATDPAAAGRANAVAGLVRAVTTARRVGRLPDLLDHVTPFVNEELVPAPDERIAAAGAAV